MMRGGTFPYAHGNINVSEGFENDSTKGGQLRSAYGLTSLPPFGSQH